jgi:hypothetical protein
MNINSSLFKENYIDAIVALNQSGLLDKIKPKMILIESIERYSIGRFSKSIQWDNNTTYQALHTNLMEGKWGEGKPTKEKSLFITTANYKFPLYNFYYQFSPNAFGHAGVYKLTLTKPLFSVAAPSTLLVYKDDITSIQNVTSKNISLLNKNFNRLSDLLMKNNIHLTVMIAVDKYDLYSSYLAKNPYGENIFFDLLRSTKKNYSFIDTKSILSTQLKKGEKDIFFADDTHWSDKASEAIIDNSSFPYLQKELK